MSTLDKKRKKKTDKVLLTMATSTELDHLPADPLLHILSFLNFRDVIQYVTDAASLFSRTAKFRPALDAICFVDKHVNKLRVVSRLASTAVLAKVCTVEATVSTHCDDNRNMCIKYFIFFEDKNILVSVDELSNVFF